MQAHVRQPDWVPRFRISAELCVCLAPCCADGPIRAQSGGLPLERHFDRGDGDQHCAHAAVVEQRHVAAHDCVLHGLCRAPVVGRRTQRGLHVRRPAQSDRRWRHGPASHPAIQSDAGNRQHHAGRSRCDHHGEVQRRPVGSQVRPACLGSQPHSPHSATARLCSTSMEAAPARVDFQLSASRRAPRSPEPLWVRRICRLRAQWAHGPCRSSAATIMALPAAAHMLARLSRPGRCPAGRLR